MWNTGDSASKVDFSEKWVCPKSEECLKLWEEGLRPRGGFLALPWGGAAQSAEGACRLCFHAGLAWPSVESVLSAMLCKHLSWTSSSRRSLVPSQATRGPFPPLGVSCVLWGARNAWNRPALQWLEEQVLENMHGLVRCAFCITLHRCDCASAS